MSLVGPNGGTLHGLSLEQRLWIRVAKGDPDECWEWVGARQHSGHGRMGLRLPGGRKTTVAVHRLSWTLHNGPIPRGLCVCHHCDNPPCVNPAHLFLGTQLDNVHDMHNKGRARGGRTSRPGEQHPLTKLTTEQVLEIQRRHATGERLALIGADFGIGRSQVSRIGTGKRWTHLAKKEEAIV